LGISKGTYVHFGNS
jgi:hypothetical protein